MGEVPTPPLLPKFIIKNTGASGYVRVEYNSEVVDVAPNSEESIEIDENVSVKVTWGIVNLDTGAFDESRINISYPNYKFETPRIVNATFDSAIQNGDSVAAIPDAANIAVKARSFTFTMPSNNYTATITFRNIELYWDFDFENPYCVDNVSVNSPVAKVKDRLNFHTDITQSNPSGRPTLKNVLGTQGVTFTRPEGLSSLAGNMIHSFPTIFIVAKIDYDENINIYHNLLFLNGVTYDALRGIYFNGGAYTLVSGAANPNTGFRTSSRKYSPFLLGWKRNLSGEIRQSNVSHGFGGSYVNGSPGITNNHRLHLGHMYSDGQGQIVSTQFRHIAFKDSLTDEEYIIIRNKLESKYNI